MKTEKQSISANVSNVPLIGDILVEKGYLTSDQQKIVTESLKSVEHKGKFFGEVATDLKLITKEQLSQALLLQAQKIAQTSTDDMQTLINKGIPLTLPSWMKPHWGNNGQVNDVSANIGLAEAASAAANVAKLIFLLANTLPDTAKQFQEGVVAAKHLTDFLAGNNTIPVNKLEQLKEKAITALKDAVEVTDNGKDVVDTYIKNRFTEINCGLDLRKNELTLEEIQK